jgi:hypothetical protein
VLPTKRSLKSCLASAGLPRAVRWLNWSRKGW